MREDDPLPFQRRNVFSATDDHVFLAIDNQDVAVLVDRGHVPGVKPSATKTSAVASGWFQYPSSLRLRGPPARRKLPILGQILIVGHRRF